MQHRCNRVQQPITDMCVEVENPATPVTSLNLKHLTRNTRFFAIFGGIGFWKPHSAWIRKAAKLFAWDEDRAPADDPKAACGKMDSTNWWMNYTLNYPCCGASTRVVGVFYSMIHVLEVILCEWENFEWFLKSVVIPPVCSSSPFHRKQRRTKCCGLNSWGLSV